MSRSAFGRAGVHVLAAWLCLATSVGAATFTASLDRDTITLGETVTLALSFDGGSPQSVPTPPDDPKLQISYIGPRSEMSLVNGRFSSSVTHSFNVTPREPGTYTIPSLTAQVGSEKLNSQPLTLRVLKPNAPSADAINSGSQPAFLKLVLPKKEFYVGETFVAQLQFYVRDGMPGSCQLQQTAFPADGFTTGKLIEAQHRRAQVGNYVYSVIPVQVPMRVLRPGPLTIGPITFNLVVTQRDPFDAFGFFGRGEQKQIPLASVGETVQSLALPRENVPTDFNGAVGNFTMSFTAGPTTVTAGDPITVKIQISGRGTLDSVSLPDQPAWHDFKTYPPTTKLDLDPLGVQGTKTFEQIVTPQNADLKALPPVSFSFFDPDQKAYRTITQPGVPLVVRPSAAVAPPTVVAANRVSRDTPPPAQDIVPIKQRLGTVAQIGMPLARQAWFLALQGIPVLAFVSLVVWRRRADAFANNPRLRRRRQVAQIVTEGLAQLRHLAAAKKSEEFFATLQHLLQEQLGERLDLPASAITEAVIDEHLRPRALPETTLAPLQELFQTCNLARYAPVKSSQELAALIPKLETVLHSLQEVSL